MSVIRQYAFLAPRDGKWKENGDWAYTERMRMIANGKPVLTPEEMAEILGVSAERLAAVRQIMNTPVRSRRKSSNGKPTGMRYSFAGRTTSIRGKNKVR